MAPVARDLNDQQGLRRSNRSNFGKPGPSLHEGYAVGETTTRPVLRHNTRRQRNKAAVDKDDEDETASASSTPTTAGREAKTRNKRRSGKFTSAADGDDELASSSSSSAIRRNSIALDCIYVKLPPSMQMPPSPTEQPLKRESIALDCIYVELPPSMQMPPSPIEQTLQSQAGSPVQQPQEMFPPTPAAQLLAPSPQQIQQTPLSLPPQVLIQACAPDGDASPLKNVANQQAGSSEVDAMDLDLDMFLNLDLQDDEEMVEEVPVFRTTPKPANDVDLDVNMTDLDDEFANAMQQYGQNSDEKIFQDRLAAQGRYSKHDGSLDELSGIAMKPSAYSDVF